MKKIKIGKMALKRETMRILTGELEGVAGGEPNSNLTCQAGCATIYCGTNYVSCPPSCPLNCGGTFPT